MRWLVLVVLCAVTACDGGASGRDRSDPDARDPGAPDASAATYHRDVRPIFERHCLSCHVEGGTTPFSMEYVPAEWPDDGRPPWASLAVASVESGSMPPWMPDEDCHPIADARVMSESERALLRDWTEAGFPAGDPADFVAPELAVPRRSSNPDVIVRAPEAYQPNRDRPDDYRCFVIDLDEELGAEDEPRDHWMTGFQLEPDVVPIVHHAILYRVGPSRAARLAEFEAEDEDPGYTCFGTTRAGSEETMAAWAPGQLPEHYPDGVARRIEAGSKLVLQVHYNVMHLPADEPVPADRTGVALWLKDGPEPPSRQLVTIPLPVTRFSIEAGDPNAWVEQEVNLPDLPIPIPVYGVMGHMHELGTSIRADVVRGEDASCLMNLPVWDFRWQQSYIFPEDQRPDARGVSGIRVRCEWDNSPANQPIVNGVQLEPRTVGWGDGTRDEMCLVYIMALVPPAIIPPGFF